MFCKPPAATTDRRGKPLDSQDIFTQFDKAPGHRAGTAMTSLKNPAEWLRKKQIYIKVKIDGLPIPKGRVIIEGPNIINQYVGTVCAIYFEKKSGSTGSPRLNWVVLNFVPSHKILCISEGSLKKTAKRPQPTICDLSKNPWLPTRNTWKCNAVGNSSWLSSEKQQPFKVIERYHISSNNLKNKK